jgi:hypothetical protein
MPKNAFLASHDKKIAIRVNGFLKYRGIEMKAQTIPVIFILPTLLCASCADFEHPSLSISEAVIESLQTDSQPEHAWRLDSAWQAKSLGGAVLRSSSIEHVVRQHDQRWNDVSELSQNSNMSNNENTESDPQSVERAWRKYCHHQLDMTAEDHEIINQFTIPSAMLKVGCNPLSLNK